MGVFNVCYRYQYKPINFVPITLLLLDPTMKTPFGFLITLCIITVGSSVEWNALKAKWSIFPAAPGIITDKIAQAFGSFLSNETDIWKALPKLSQDVIKKLMPQFATIPRTVKETKKPFWDILGADWEKVDDECENKYYLGYRYVYKDDWALNLLMDKNGYIVGLQTNVISNEFSPARPLRDTYYLENGNLWTQTVYFVDPSTICKGARGNPEKEGTGTGLWIQKGPNLKEDFHVIPLNEEEVKQKGWGSGKCFPTMGMHYWYNVTEGMSCDNFVPYCLLYNNNKLTGFCFIKNTHRPKSNRYDFPSPTNSVFEQFLNPLPTCFKEDKSYKELRTIHVYFKDDAEFESNC